MVDKATLDSMLSNLRRYVAVLIEEGILPEALRESYRGMARFHNRLVHLYWEVDDGVLHQP